MKVKHSQLFFKIILSFSVLLTAVACQTRNSDVKMSPRQVEKWFNSGEWTNGCQLKPHKSINKNAFAKEYFTNPVLWNKTFEWLKTNDLDLIPPGRYIIDEGNIIATVSEGPAPEIDKVKWEIHKNYNDLQYIIKGKALMGSVLVSNATLTEAYDPKMDIAFFNAEGNLYNAEPGTFFIFTPEDVHRPGIKADDYNDSVKKIVIKIRSAYTE